MSSGFWANFGGLVLLAILLGAVMTVVESVLRTVGVHAAIMKIPVIGANFTLLVSILMMWVVDLNVLGYWGITGDWDKWFVYVVNGAIIYGVVPVKDAVVSMISKGFRM